MIKVKQRKTHIPGKQNGDCARACIASIFEIAYEETEGITGYSNEIYDWTRERYPGVETKTVFLDEMEKEWEFGLRAYLHWPQSHYERGYWMATIWSPRIEDRIVAGGVLWGLHAVVMKGSDIVWDPHPEPIPTDMIYFKGATTWGVTDPSKLNQVARIYVD